MPFCNVFISQVEGVLVAITQLHCCRIGSNSSLVLTHTTKSYPSHLHTGELLAGAAGRGAGPDPGSTQALSCHSELNSQKYIDRVQGSREQVGHMLFLSGQPANLHGAPTKSQILFWTLSGDNAQKDSVIQVRGSGHKDQHSLWLPVLTDAPKKIKWTGIAGSAGVGTVFTWESREGCSEKGHLIPNLNKEKKTAFQRCGGCVLAGAEATCRTRVSDGQERLRDRRSMGGVEGTQSVCHLSSSFATSSQLL